MSSQKPTSLLEVLQGSADFLKKQQIENPRLNAEHLLAHVLQIPRLELYLQFERLLAEAQLAPLRELLRKRSKSVPLQHLLGTVEFFGRTFLCDPRGLIPRPETEQLIERALTHTNAKRILDVGTGSGVIAITLALEKKNAQIAAIDLSLEALDLAQENAARHELSSIVWHQGNLLEPLKKRPSEGSFKMIKIDEAPGARSTVEKCISNTQRDEHRSDGVIRDCRHFQTTLSEPFDLIVANLPYIPREEIKMLSREVHHDPAMALDGGLEGLDLIEQLIEQAPEHLCDGGHLLLEIGKDQAEATMNFLKKNNYSDIIALPDYQGVLRFVEASYAD